jgi:hypothetical protein
VIESMEEKAAYIPGVRGLGRDIPICWGLVDPSEQEKARSEILIWFCTSCQQYVNAFQICNISKKNYAALRG